MEIIAYVAIGIVGLVLCLRLIAVIAYAATQKSTAKLFERDAVDLPFKALSARPERRRDVDDVPEDLNARAPAVALLPVCIDGDEANLSGPLVEPPRARDQTAVKILR